MGKLDSVARPDFFNIYFTSYYVKTLYIDSNWSTRVTKKNKEHKTVKNHQHSKKNRTQRLALMCPSSVKIDIIHNSKTQNKTYTAYKTYRYQRVHYGFQFLQKYKVRSRKV